jgi:hypothetical protein
MTPARKSVPGLIAKEIRFARQGILRMRANGFGKKGRRLLVQEHGFNNAVKMAARIARKKRAIGFHQAYVRREKEWGIKEYVQDLYDRLDYDSDAAAKTQRSLIGRIPKKYRPEPMDTINDAIEMIVLKSKTKEGALKRLKQLERFLKEEPEDADALDEPLGEEESVLPNEHQTPQYSESMTRPTAPASPAKKRRSFWDWLSGRGAT